MQPVNSWTGRKGIQHDWHWLLSLHNAGNEFKKSCLVFFLPGREILEFYQVCRIPKNSSQYGEIDYAPFVRLVKPNNAGRLVYSNVPARDLFIRFSQGRLIVRRQMVGSPRFPVWALLFSRVGRNEFERLTSYSEREIDGAPFDS